MLDEQTSGAPKEDFFVVAGDLNMHVRAEKADNKGHGGSGFEEHDTERERILDYAVDHDHERMVPKTRILSAGVLQWHYVSRIDFVSMCRRRLETAFDAKANPYETLLRSQDLSFLRCALSHQSGCIKKEMDLRGSGCGDGKITKKKLSHVLSYSDL